MSPKIKDEEQISEKRIHSIIVNDQSDESEILLPNPTSDEEYDKINFEDDVFRAAILKICQLEKIQLNELERFETGSNPVFGVSQLHIIKMFAPIDIEYFEVERDSLCFLAEKNFTYAPKLFSVGEIFGWWYLLMERVSGMSLAEAWPLLKDYERRSVLLELGEITKRLHTLPVQNRRLGSLVWNDFVQQQKANAVSQQRKYDLQEELIQMIPEFLEVIRIKDRSRMSFLHTELMREHIFVQKFQDQWRISGIIDFEPSMIGDPEYDFASVGLFVSKDETHLFRFFLEGYGFDLLDTELSERIMVYVLLHRYSNLQWYLRFMPQENSFRKLATQWFPVKEVNIL